MKSVPESAPAEASDDGPPTFATLFAKVYARLWLLAAALIGDRTEAEDLVQEAAIVGLQKFSQFEAGSNFAAWMARIVRFHASNWRSKQSRRRTQSTDPVDIDRAHADADPARDAVVAESAAGDMSSLADGFDDAVLAALETVAQVPRACLLLKVVHELSYDEIGDLLGIPPGTAMSHVHRSRTKLRKRLSPSEADTAS
ncbi:MAG: RNA polymerase sigma factor [Planctomycetota bacterium]